LSQERKITLWGIWVTVVVAGIAAAVQLYSADKQREVIYAFIMTVIVAVIGAALILHFSKKTRSTPEVRPEVLPIGAMELDGREFYLNIKNYSQSEVALDIDVFIRWQRHLFEPNPISSLGPNESLRVLLKSPDKDKRPRYLRSDSAQKDPAAYLRIDYSDIHRQRRWTTRAKYKDRGPSCGNWEIQTIRSELLI
jgi:hypothetical protein